MLIFLVVILLIILGVFVSTLLGGEKSQSPKDLVVVAPKVKTDYFQLGLEEFRRSTFDKAQRNFEEHLKKHHDHIPSHQYLAQCYKAQRMIEEEIEVYNSLLELDLENEKGITEHAVRFELASVCFDNKMYLEAFDNFLLLMHGSKFDSDVVNRCAFIYASQGRFEFAENLYKKILEKEMTYMDAKHGLVLCYLGQDKPNMTKKMIRELVTDRHEEAIHWYILGKVCTGLEEIDERLKAFYYFLQKANKDQGIMIMDALLNICKIYYSEQVLLEPEQIEYWIETFENVHKKVTLSKKQNLEILLQLGFLHFFADVKAEKFTQTLNYWQLCLEIDPDYRKVSYWHGFVKSYKPHKYKEFTIAYKNNRVAPLDVFPPESTLQAKEFYTIFPIDIDNCENNARVKLGQGGVKAPKAKESKLDKLLNMSAQQFEIKLSKLLKSEGFTVVESISTEVEKTFNYVLEDKKKKKYYCSAYQSNKPIGELELQNLLSGAKIKDLAKCVAFNVNGFSKEAKVFAENYSIKMLDKM
ncbi:MAG: restriction endonuclease [Candidatus Cloacimonetes bacterium]|nr:restriction endonuclease [Candidatus Cloacimonadota bacterium]